MSKPKFEFLANNTTPDDDSGVAVWRYTDPMRDNNTEIVVRQDFPSFRAAFAMDGLISLAFVSGEAQGYAHCERKVLESLKSA